MMDDVQNGDASVNCQGCLEPQPENLELGRCEPCSFEQH